MINSDLLEPTEEQVHRNRRARAENRKQLEERFADNLKNSLNDFNERYSVHTAILTVFSRVIEHNDLGEEDAIRFVKAMVIPDDLNIVRRDDPIGNLFFHSENQDEPLFYRFFLEENYFASRFRADEKSDIVTVLSRNLLPVSTANSAGVTLLHLALSKKYFTLVFILVSELKADINKKSEFGQAPCEVFCVDISHTIYQHEASKYVLHLLSDLPPNEDLKEQIRRKPKGNLYVSKVTKDKVRCLGKAMNNKFIDTELNIFIGNRSLTDSNLDNFRDSILKKLANRGFIIIDLYQELLDTYENRSTPIEHCSQFTQKVFFAIDNTINIWQKKKEKTWKVWAKYLEKVQKSIDTLNHLKQKLTEKASFFSDNDFLSYVKEEFIDKKLGDDIEPGSPGFSEIDSKTWCIGEFDENKSLLEDIYFFLAERRAIEPNGVISKLKLRWRETFKNEYDDLSYSSLLTMVKPGLIQTYSMCSTSNDNRALIKIASGVLADYEEEKQKYQEDNRKLKQQLDTTKQKYSTLLSSVNTNFHEEPLLPQKVNETTTYPQSESTPFFNFEQSEEKKEKPEEKIKSATLRKNH